MKDELNLSDLPEEVVEAINDCGEKGYADGVEAVKKLAMKHQNIAFLQMYWHAYCVGALGCVGTTVDGGVIDNFFETLVEGAMKARKRNVERIKGVKRDAPNN